MLVCKTPVSKNLWKCWLQAIQTGQIKLQAAIAGVEWKFAHESAISSRKSEISDLIFSQKKSFPLEVWIYILRS